MRKVSASRLAGIGIPIVLIGGLTALEVCSRSVRDWTSQRPFTMNIAADFLVLTVTLFGVDVVLKRREERRWRQLVGPAVKNWIDRALVLAAALGYYESDDPDVGSSLLRQYRQIGFEANLMFAGDVDRGFAWVEPALGEWLAETRGLQPLLMRSTDVFEAATTVANSFETCLGGSSWFSAIKDDAGTQIDFFRDMGPLVERQIGRLAETLDLEMALSGPPLENYDDESDDVPAYDWTRTEATGGTDAAYAADDEIPF